MAVLNFRLLSRDSTDAYLAEGLADAVTSRLSQVERLDVASRTAARLGRTPRAAYIVSGTMLRQNQRLVVNVELLRASTGRNAWAQRYERPDTAVLGLERDIAIGVAGAVLPAVTQAERTALGIGGATSNEAWDHILRGDFSLARRSLGNVSRALQEYEMAARLDPRNARAHARIALASAIWFDWEWDAAGRPPPDSVLAKGIAASERAVALDSMSSDAWLARAYIGVFAFPRTWEGVEASFRRSIALDPRNAEAHHQYGDWLSMASRAAEATAALERALAVDPLRVVSLRNLGSESVSGLPLLDSAMRLNPDDFVTHNSRKWIRLRARDTSGARADAEAALRLAPREARLQQLCDHVFFELVRGDTVSARATFDEARRLLAPSGPLGTRMISCSRAQFVLGDQEAAFALVERVQPRGALLWHAVMDARTDLTPIPDRFRRVLEEARPPWVR